MSTRDLIDAIATGGALDIESAFENTMAEKVSGQIETKRLQIARSMFATDAVDLKSKTTHDFGDGPIPAHQHSNGGGVGC